MATIRYATTAAFPARSASRATCSNGAPTRTCPACDPRIADLDAIVVIVCQQGYQSSLAASNLHELGFTHATDLEGGFEAWRAEGLPIETAAISPI